MDTNKQLKKLEKEMKKDHKKDVGFRYPSVTDMGRNYARYLRNYERTISQDKHPIALVEIFKNQHSWYLDNAHYQILKLEDKEKGIQYLSNAAAYGYLTLLAQVACFYCDKVPSQQYQSIHTGSMLMSEVLLCGWEDEYKEIAEWFIDSIAYGRQEDPEHEGIYIHKIILSGENDHLIGWFLLDLYCEVYNRTYDSKSAKYPKDMLFFSEIVKKWDTKDMIEVDKFVYLMSEYHLMNTQEERTDDDLFVFDNSRYWLFPIEILAWLKLRKMHGLEIPTTFTHPFMNTPFAKVCLEIVPQTLTKPNELPYVDGLIKNFNTLCPNMKAPLWLASKIDL